MIAAAEIIRVLVTITHWRDCMRFTSAVAAIVVATGIAGCSSSDGVGPTTTYRMQNVNDTTLVLLQGESVPAASLPQVRVTTLDNKPAPGVQVTFTRTVNLIPTKYVVATDQNGIARLDAWPVPTQGGVYTCTVTTSGPETARFWVFVRGATVATYRQTEPTQFAGLGYIALYDDGTLSYKALALPAQRELPTSRYTVVDQTTLEVRDIYGRFNGLEVWKLNGDKLTIPDENVVGGVSTFSRIATSSPASAINYKVQSVTPMTFIAKPGETIDSSRLPAVRLLYPNNFPAAGVSVTFSQDAERTYSTVTDASGIARLDSWHINSTVGDHTIAAIILGQQRIAYSAFIHGKIVSAFDLAVPFPGSSQRADGSHYILFDDGTYVHYLNARVADESLIYPSGSYFVKDSATIEFKSWGALLDIGGVGKLKGQIMTVYLDPVDFEPETYVRRE